MVLAVFCSAKIAHAAGAYTYATFLSGLKNMTDVITEKEKTPNALGGYKDFYDTRGVILHDIELIEVELTDEELERNIVDAMAMEAIDRINRVEQEISEAEVAVVALNGAHQIEVARADNERTLEDLTAANTLAAEMHAQTLQIAQQENAQTLALNELNNSLTLENTRLEYAPLQLPSARSRPLAPAPAPAPVSQPLDSETRENRAMPPCCCFVLTCRLCHATAT